MAYSNNSNRNANDLHQQCCRQIHLPLLTDMYQITMAYAYWKNGMSNRYSVFDLFFRKNPFNGEFTVFAGLGECLNYLKGFSYCSDDIQFLRSILPATVEEEFFEYLSNINANDIVLYAVPEGSVVFPKEPLLRIEGPLLICQLLETTLLTLVNYSSLISTNAARYQIAIDNRPIQLYEFGLRRAQGPDGGLTASKYAYVGGFDGTSNLLAGRLYGIPVKGTHAHSFIMSHSTIDDLKSRYLKSKITGNMVDFAQICFDFKDELATLLNVLSSESSTSEFVAFISYAIAFPESFVALVDTYDMIRKPKAASAAASNSSFSCNSTEFDPNLIRLQSEECSPYDRNKLLSGILNFCAVALALNKLGYRAVGIRIDSGDLAYQSIMAYESFSKVSQAYKLDWFKSLLIIASNDINEETIISLNEQKHKINAFGIGTHLVTCQRQPALGCVYKLVEVDQSPCIKISLDVEKVTIPARKNVYRLYGQEGYALLDLMQSYEEEEPKVGEKVLCRHPFQESKRCFATPSRVEKLLQVWWSDGKIQQTLPTLEQIRDHVRLSLSQLRPDVKRLLNATPYKVSVTNDLYQFMHRLWLENAPVGELH